MKALMICLAAGALVFANAGSLAFAANGIAPTTTLSGQVTTFGQPNASCEQTPTTPGNAASAPGSAFNPNGIAGTVYAGEQPQNSKNPKSVSQYDVACTHQPN